MILVSRYALMQCLGVSRSSRDLQGIIYEMDKTCLFISMGHLHHVTLDYMHTCIYHERMHLDYTNYAQLLLPYITVAYIYLRWSGGQPLLISSFVEISNSISFFVCGSIWTRRGHDPCMHGIACWLAPSFMASIEFC